MNLPQTVHKYAFFLSLVSLFLGAGFSSPALAATQLSFNPTSLRFGEVVVGQSVTFPVTVTNKGTSRFTISTMTASSGYRTSHPALPFTLAPGKSLSVNVTFSPTTSGADAGTIVINGSTSFAVHGSGAASTSVVPNPSSIAFGSMQDGSTARSYITLTNRKSGNTTISSVAQTGPGFSVQGLALPMTLTSGQSVTFSVLFSPQTSGSVTGMLQFMNPRNSMLAWVPLSGTGTTSGQLSVSPSSASFGNVTVGSTASQTGRLTAGGASVTITSASSSSSEFSLKGISLPATIAAGQSVSYSITFTPQSSGTASATLSFASNGSTAAESLTGTGVSTVQHTVSLNWNPSTSQVNGYNVYRGSTAGGPYAKLNSSPDPNTAFMDSTVASTHTYYYVTTAVSSTGMESSYSNQVKVSVP
jgi:hypothetical protein